MHVFLCIHFCSLLRDCQGLTLWQVLPFLFFPNHLHTWTGAVLHEYITQIKEGILEVHEDSSGTTSSKGHQHIYTILISKENKWWTERSKVQRPVPWRIMTLFPFTGREENEGNSCISKEPQSFRGTETESDPSAPSEPAEWFINAE